MDNLGGMQRVAVDLHAALDGHEDIQLFDHVMRSSWRWRYLNSAGYVVSLYASLPGWIKRRNIDVVLFSSMVTAAVALPFYGFFRRAGCKTVAIAHGLDVVEENWFYQHWIVPRVFQSLDAAAPVSTATAEVCLERGLPESKLHVIPNGVHADRFAHIQPDIEGLPGGVDSLPENRLLLCSIGRHVKRKGFDWFVDQVMPKLPGHVHFWLAGEGEMSDVIQSTISRRGLEKRVRLLGNIPDEQVKALFEVADLFIMPNLPVESDMEGFGVVLLEAGLCGLPSVAARLEGVQDVVAEGISGHFARSGDPESFIWIIRRLDSDRQALERLSSSTKSHTIDSFGWSVMADKFAHLFRTLFSSG